MRYFRGFYLPAVLCHLGRDFRLGRDGYDLDGNVIRMKVKKILKKDEISVTVPYSFQNSSYFYNSHPVPFFVNSNCNLMFGCVDVSE